MSGIPHDHYEPKTRIEKWLNSRLPIVGLVYDTLMLPTPRNLNWMWIWGIVLVFALVMQILTGIVVLPLAEIVLALADFRTDFGIGCVNHAPMTAD